MSTKVEQTLNSALRNWEAMSRAETDNAEESANEFESSFYQFIDALRDWVNGLEQRPQSMDELMEMPLITHICSLLPAPLYLNFETEAELIIENKSRINDDKYD